MFAGALVIAYFTAWAAMEVVVFDDVEINCVFTIIGVHAECGDGVAPKGCYGYF